MTFMFYHTKIRLNFCCAFHPFLKWIILSCNLRFKIIGYLQMKMFCSYKNHKRIQKLIQYILYYFSVFYQLTLENHLDFQLHSNTKMYSEKCRNVIFDVWLIINLVCLPLFLFLFALYSNYILERFYLIQIELIRKDVVIIFLEKELIKKK